MLEVVSSGTQRTPRPLLLDHKTSTSMQQAAVGGSAHQEEPEHAFFAHLLKTLLEPLTDVYYIVVSALSIWK